MKSNGTSKALRSALIALLTALLVEHLPASTVGWWSFEEGAPGTEAVGANSILDYSGNGLHGTPGTSPTYTSEVSPWSGSIGHVKSMYYNGWDDRVYIAESPVLQLTHSLTIEAIFKAQPMVPGTGAGGNLLSRGDNRAGLDPYRLTLLGGNRLTFQIQDAADHVAAVSYTVPYDQWLFAAATLDGCYRRHEALRE